VFNFDFNNCCNPSPKYQITMNRILLIVRFWGINAAISQTVIYNEPFDNPESGWAHENNLTKAEIKNSTLLLENKSTDQAAWQLANSGLSNTDSLDFDIEAHITLKKTVSDNATFGIAWGVYNDYSNYRVFRISGNSQTQIYHYYNNNYEYQKAWSVSNAVSKQGVVNHFKIQKRANITQFFLNGQLIYSTGDNDYFGYQLGFILDGGVQIAAEDLIVTEYRRKINIAEGFDPKIQLVALPSHINTTEYQEVSPVISADGNLLFFARKDSPNNVDGPNDDIWYSTKNAMGDWNTAKNIGKPLNNKSFNFVISISPDNNSLLIGNTYNPDGSIKGQGVSQSKKSFKGFEVPKELNIEDYINNNEYVAYFLTNDNEHILMAVERPEGKGQKDLYVSHLKPSGAWTKPETLGQTINTTEDEINPFLSSDGKTLYFASNGHYGYGYYDIFVSKRIGSKWNEWSTPQNLGPVINTPSSELSIFLTAKADKAYVARGGDLFVIDNTIKQDPVVLVKGKVYDQKTQKPMSADIEYYNLSSNHKLGTALSDPITGNYSIILPYGQAYSFMANKKAYYAITQNIDLKHLTEYQEVERDLYLNPIEKGEIIRLNNIFFESGQYNLLPESFSELDRLIHILQSNPKMSIAIQGHTDAVGTDANNLTLSEQRAASVKKYLIEKGIDSARLSSKGFGETHFIADNNTEISKQKNRRVEFQILEM